MLEVSFGIVASCLPTLRALFQTSSVDSVLRSMRSKVSLGSGNPASHGDLPLHCLNRNGSKASHEEPLVYPDQSYSAGVNHTLTRSLQH
jgi:hypothetical protein